MIRELVERLEHGEGTEKAGRECGAPKTKGDVGTVARLFETLERRVVDAKNDAEVVREDDCAIDAEATR